MNKTILGKLLHIANGYPHCLGDHEAFYEMKHNLLMWFGNGDGYDLQHFPGKGCFACGGTETNRGSGIYVGYHTCSGDEWQDTCNRCWGSGWYRRPRWIVLNRWRLDRFTFHTPGQIHYEEPDAGTTRKRINGFIEHRNGYSYELERKAHRILKRYHAAFYFAMAHVSRRTSVV